MALFARQRELLPPEGWLRDRFGRRLAEIRHERGRAVLQDRLGNPLGSYDPDIDRTVDSRGKTVGRGNWLAALLRPDAS